MVHIRPEGFDGLRVGSWVPSFSRFPWGTFLPYLSDLLSCLSRPNCRFVFKTFHSLKCHSAFSTARPFQRCQEGVAYGREEPSREIAPILEVGMAGKRFLFSSEEKPGQMLLFSFPGMKHLLKGVSPHWKSFPLGRWLSLPLSQCLTSSRRGWCRGQGWR